MAENTVNKRQVLAWLGENSELFVEHPELLDQMRIPHGAGAISLIEHQVVRLQRQNHKLRSQLEHLTAIAADNERLMRRLQDFSLELVATRTPESFVECLTRRLADDFRAEQIRLNLFAPPMELDGLSHVHALPGEPARWLTRLISGPHPECGRPTRAKLEVLFGPSRRPIGSAALVPIPPGIGVLAIGAESPQRFEPDMGTLFLELLGRVIGYRLERMDSSQRKSA